MTDPRWQTVREALESIEGAECGCPKHRWVRESLAALDSLEAEMDILATDYWDAENRAERAEAEMREMQRANDQLGEQADLQGAEAQRLRGRLKAAQDRLQRIRLLCAEGHGDDLIAEATGVSFGPEKAQAEIERLREALGGIDRVLTLSKGMAEDVDDNEAALAEIVGEHPGWYDLAVRDWVHDIARAALGGEE